MSPVGSVDVRFLQLLKLDSWNCNVIPDSNPALALSRLRSVASEKERAESATAAASPAPSGVSRSSFTCGRGSEGGAQLGAGQGRAGPGRVGPGRGRVRAL